MTRPSRARRLLAGLALIALVQPALAQDSSGSGATLKTAAGGEQIYRQICAACHMPDAQGSNVAGKVPALANNPKLADAAYPITMVLKGRGGMPWFGDTLKPAQVAEVVGYIRTHFGNAYAEPVTRADVLKLSTDPPVAE